MRRLCLILLLAPTIASAMDYGDFVEGVKTPAGRAIVTAYLDGFAHAVQAYELAQSQDRRPQRLCIPEGTPVKAELLAGIVDATVKETPSLAGSKMPLSAILWVGLGRTFRCRAL